MRHALQLARRNIGQTWPNPAVGAVVAKDGVVIGTGWTARGGRPHAEPQALAQAGASAKGATLYVTLEPCCTTGKTPPCTDAIIESGIVHVVIACRDPHKDVNGKGIEQLQKAGISVTENIANAEAEKLNEGFFSVVKRGRPFVSLKTATSLDGKIATRIGQSQWITGEQARAFGHVIRSEHDALMTGIGTVLADDPLLTCRAPGLLGRSPVRVILDSSLRLPADSELAASARDIPVWVLTGNADSKEAKALADKGVHILSCPVKDGRVELKAALSQLTKIGITRVLAEAGSNLTTALIREALIDRIYWFRGPTAIGDDGKSAVGNLNINQLTDATRLKRKELIALDPDMLEILEAA